MRTRRENYRENSRSINPNQRNQQNLPKESQNQSSLGGNLPQSDLNQIYNNVKSIPNYSSKIADFSRTNVTSSVHRQVRKKFPTRRIVSYFPFQITMSDLIDYSHSPMPFNNNGFRYIMIFICCFTKFAWAEPLKRKDGLSSTIALEKIFNRMKEIPQYFVTDQGLAYYDHRVKKVYDRLGITH